MKILIIFIFSIFSVFSQNINVQSELKLIDLFELIEEQTEYKFVFQDEVKNINYIFKTKGELSLENIIQKIEKETNLSFLITDKLISVKLSNNNKTKSLKGYVFDSSTNQPLISATLRTQSSGVISNSDGSFSLKISESDSIIKVTYVGYKEKVIKLNNAKSPINIYLEPDQALSEEVLVVGYSTQKAKDLTGAISKVDVDRINNAPVNGVEQALQGQVSGVQITNDGSPGGGTSVRIRGFGTIGDNDPLYIIDGIPTKTNLNNFSMNDIESIQVLKDASATAIYGSRASNGVVIITTKSGKNNSALISYDFYSGYQVPTNLPKMLNTQEYVDLLWEAERNSGKTPTNDLFGDGADPVIPEFIDDEQIIRASVPGTDWFDELFNPALISNHQLSFQKRSDLVNTFISLNYMNQDGIMNYTSFEKFGVRINSSINQGNWNFGENIYISSANTKSVPTNQALGSRIIHTYRINPVVPVYDIHGDFAGPVNGVQGALNPIGINYLDKDDDDRVNRLFGNLFAHYEIIEGLNIKSNVGIDYSYREIIDYDPKYQMGITGRGETSFLLANINTLQFTLNSLAEYKFNYLKNNFTVLSGFEVVDYSYKEMGGTASNFLTDELDFIQLNTGDGKLSNFSGGTDWALVSQFGRLDYNYNEKYLFSASIRRDGSSRFSEANRYGYFPAFSMGWRASEESFLKDLSFISNLKFRFSWGRSGNQEIGDFTSFSTFSASAWDTYYDIEGNNQNANIGLKSTRIGNPNIKWETTTQSNFGINYSPINNLSFNIDYFIKNTEDILLQRPTLAIEGQAEAPFVNLGEIRNTGVELEATYFNNLWNDLNMTLNGNITFIKNEVVALADDVIYLTGIVNNTFSRDLTLTRTQVGFPISQFYGHVADGIFKNQTEVNTHAEQDGKGIGRIRYKDLNNDGVIDENDRQVIGSPHPDFMFGLNLGFNYKGFDLQVFLQGVYGNEIYNFTRYYTDFFYDLGNRHERIKDAWSTTNINSEIPRISSVDVNNELRPSTYFIEDGSFLRIKNVQLGYTFNNLFHSINLLRIYIQAQNLFTFTNYEGMDPEVGLVNYSNPERNLDIGVDRGIYPNSRSFLLGINIKI